MIISASRRTDIPAFYADWFIDNIKNQNPFMIRNKEVYVNQDNTDCIVFWTKNPHKLMTRLHELTIPYYFQFTLNSYGIDVEPFVPNKNNIVIPTMNQLADTIGSNKIVWRYDPILISPYYSLDYHIKYFELLAKRLYKSCRSCTFSFVDMYGSCSRKLQKINGRAPTKEEEQYIAKSFSEIASAYNIKLQTCAEIINLEQYNITHGACIDPDIINEITGKKYDLHKDITQRSACRCVSSIDIGEYNTCKHDCLYCYACS